MTEKILLPLPQDNRPEPRPNVPWTKGPQLARPHNLEPTSPSDRTMMVDQNNDRRDSVQSGPLAPIQIPNGDRQRMSCTPTSAPKPLFSQPPLLLHPPVSQTSISSLPTRILPPIDVSRNEFSADSSSASSFNGSVVSVYSDCEPLLEPPATEAMLRELDWERFADNPSLRHRLNFEPDSEFSPITRGFHGQARNEKRITFWTQMHGQLQTYIDNSMSHDTLVGGKNWSLPNLIRTFGKLLKTCIKPQQYAQVDAAFEITLVMKSFNQRHDNWTMLTKTWYDFLLTVCAQQREAQIKRVITWLDDGVKSLDAEHIVVGLRMFLEVLETMKLDLANDQLRQLAPSLIADTVSFEKRYYMAQIVTGKIDILKVHGWYHSAINASTSILWTPNTSHVNPFVKIPTLLVVPSMACNMPATFDADVKQLLEIRAMLLDIINIQVCMTFLPHQAHAIMDLGPMLGDRAKAPPPLPAPSAEAFSRILAAMPALLASASGPDKWNRIAEDVATHIIRSTDTPMSFQPQYVSMLSFHLSNVKSKIYQKAEACVIGRLWPIVQRLHSAYSSLDCLELSMLRFREHRRLEICSEAAASVMLLQEIAARLAHIGVIHWKVWADMAYLLKF